MGLLLVFLLIEIGRIGFSGVVVVPDGHHVSRISDFIMYSVEAEYLEKVVAQYGPCTSHLIITIIMA